MRLTPCRCETGTLDYIWYASKVAWNDVKHLNQHAGSLVPLQFIVNVIHTSAIAPFTIFIASVYALLNHST